MAQPPNLKTHFVSPEKLQTLCDQHSVQQKLSQCRLDCTAQSQNYWDDRHEKKELKRYIDTTTDDEILVVAEYTYVDPDKPTVRIPLRLRIDNDIYILRLPS